MNSRLREAIEKAVIIPEGLAPKPNARSPLPRRVCQGAVFRPCKAPRRDTQKETLHLQKG